MVKIFFGLLIILLSTCTLNCAENLSVLSKKEYNQLNNAITNGNLDMIRSIARKYNINYVEKLKIPIIMTALKNAPYELKYKCIEILINSGADPNYSTCPNRETPLMIISKHILCAIQNKKGYELWRETPKLLIEHGADVDAKDIFGKTALMYSVRNIVTAPVLLECDANPDLQDKSGKTALMYSATNMLGIVALLLKYDANPNIHDNSGKTALYYAFKNKKLFMLYNLELLLKSKADINVKDNEGNTLLIYVFLSTINPEILGKAVEFLLSNGIMINITNNSGKTALDYAIEKNYINLVDLLRKHGAKTAKELGEKK